MYDELLDVVNERDEVVGQEYRSLVWEKNVKNFRTINGFIMNDNKELWIPRRSPTKQLFPLCLDASVGGHVMAGESYDQAFARELYEETRVDVLTINSRCVAKLTPLAYDISSYSQMYVIFDNDTPHYNQDDFVDYQWIGIEPLVQKIHAGEPVKSDLPTLITVLQDWLHTHHRQ